MEHNTAQSQDRLIVELWLNDDGSSSLFAWSEAGEQFFIRNVGTHEDTKAARDEEQAALDAANYAWID